MAQSSTIVNFIPLSVAYEKLLNIDQVHACTEEDHISNTPQRAAKALLELLSGCWESPTQILSTKFSARKYDELIYVNDISFVSICSHHLLPFLGKAHFAYLPGTHIVGLSKIPRLVKCFAKRPQVQESLTQDIVDAFMTHVNPKGCGLVIEAWHLCMSIRGTEQRPAYMKTTALRGVFKKTGTKSEFLDGVKQASKQIWP